MQKQSRVTIAFRCTQLKLSSHWPRFRVVSYARGRLEKLSTMTLHTHSVQKRKKKNNDESGIRTFLDVRDMFY